jgi:hypothetical protein
MQQIRRSKRDACKVAFWVTSPVGRDQPGKLPQTPFRISCSRGGRYELLSAAGEEQRCKRDYRRRKCKTAEEGTPDQSAVLLGNLQLSERHARSNCDHGNRDRDQRRQAYQRNVRCVIIVGWPPKSETTVDPSKYAQDRRAHKPSRSFIRQSGGERRNQCKEDQRCFPYRKIKIGLNNYRPPAQC